MKYRIGGKEKRLTIGVYPQVPLTEARQLRDEAKKLLSQGIDPSAQKKAQKTLVAERTANTFEVVSLEWVSRQQQKWSESYLGNVKGSS